MTPKLENCFFLCPDIKKYYQMIKILYLKSFSHIFKTIQCTQNLYKILGLNGYDWLIGALSYRPITVMEGLSLPSALNRDGISSLANGLFGFGSFGVPSTRVYSPIKLPQPITLCRIQQWSCQAKTYILNNIHVIYVLTKLILDTLRRGSVCDLVNELRQRFPGKYLNNPFQKQFPFGLYEKPCCCTYVHT